MAQEESRSYALLAAMALLASSVALAKPPAATQPGSRRWGGNYFPNVPLVTHEGKAVHFFDDLIKGKVVMINFIYTTCPDSCPLETAQLLKVQRILGDRVGRDVFMYSISIDPKTDTPEVLRKYMELYGIGPGWSFLTGEEKDITLLRKKLGLYIPEIQNGTNDHNLSMVIGNEATGQWKKSSPFENPYYLADQIGGWLHNWKMPSKKTLDYAHAPKLRDLSEGEKLYRTRCVACHTIGGGDIMKPSERKVGPDLLGVVQMRDRAWLVRWLAEPETMLREKDPVAMGLFAQYNNLPMPNMRLNPHEIDRLIAYMDKESRRVKNAMRLKTLASSLKGGKPKACCSQHKDATLVTAPSASEPLDIEIEAKHAAIDLGESAEPRIRRRRLLTMVSTVVLGGLGFTFLFLAHILRRIR